VHQPTQNPEVIYCLAGASSSNKASCSSRVAAMAPLKDFLLSDNDFYR
jgi:hypothetical protein